MTLMDDLEELRAAFKKGQEEWEQCRDKLWMDMDYYSRLAVTDIIFRVLVDHAKEGGSFRYLIYDRLGFGPDAYSVLYCAGGMTISNEFVLENKK